MTMTANVNQVKTAIHLQATKVPMVMSTDPSRSLEKCAVACHAFAFTYSTVYVNSGNLPLIYQGFSLISLNFMMYSF